MYKETVLLKRCFFIAVKSNEELVAWRLIMKHKTEGVTELIIDAAKQEFLTYGYMEASLRRIASACNVSTHTIYTRFEGKEGLFDAIVSESAEGLRIIHLDALNSADANNGLSANEDIADKGTTEVLKFIYSNYEDFKIIICKSAGTKYEHYLDELAKTEEQYYRKMIGEINGENQKISDFFIHATCSGAFKPIYEVVAHDLSYDEAVEFLKMQEQFNFAGWKAVLKVKNK